MGWWPWILFTIYLTQCHRHQQHYRHQSHQSRLSLMYIFYTQRQNSHSCQRQNGCCECTTLLWLCMPFFVLIIYRSKYLIRFDGCKRVHSCIYLFTFYFYTLDLLTPNLLSWADRRTLNRTCDLCQIVYISTFIYVMHITYVYTLYKCMHADAYVCVCVRERHREGISVFELPCLSATIWFICTDCAISFNSNLYLSSICWS